MQRPVPAARQAFIGEVTPMPEIDVAANYAAMGVAANKLLRECLGPQFTSTPDGHIQTDIAAACSLSGLMILQETVPDVYRSKPGNVIISETYSRQEVIFDFMTNVVISDGRRAPSGVWDNFTAINDPMFSCEEMTRRLAPRFYELCGLFARPYHKYIAALAGMKLVLAGDSRGLLDFDVGQGLAAYYVVAGSKTAPYPEALWPRDPAGA